MPLVFRSMVPDESGERPRIKADKNSLGVVTMSGDPIRDDISVEDGFVRTGRAGMSVAPAAAHLPIHRVPRRFRGRVPAEMGVPDGNNSMKCWTFGDGPFVDGPIADDLVFRTSPEGDERHGVIAPARDCGLAEFVAALNATQSSWAACPWPWEEASS